MEKVVDHLRTLMRRTVFFIECFHPKYWRA